MRYNSVTSKEVEMYEQKNRFIFAKSAIGENAIRRRKTTNSTQAPRASVCDAFRYRVRRSRVTEQPLVCNAHRIITDGEAEAVLWHRGRSGREPLCFSC